MKEKLKNKKVLYTIIGIVSVLLVMLAVTYAYWLVTKTQTGENEISSACLDISISGEKNDIELTNQFPMSDEDGMKLVPYEFTVTNNCNTSVDYQVALEATGDSSNAISSSALKVALDDSAKLYSAYPEVETTINGAYESRVLGFAKLSSAGTEGSSKTYSLRIWIDEDALISEMNKTFKSRISVTIGQGIESPYEEGTLAYDILANYSGANAINELDLNTKSLRITGIEGINWSLQINPTASYYYGTDYEYDEHTDKFTLSGTITKATISQCENGTVICGDYTFQNSNATYSNSSIYKMIDAQNARVKRYIIKKGNELEEMAINNKIYKAEDDYGTSYYFRGAATNNYLQFGTYTRNYIRVRGYYNETSTNYYEYKTIEECNNATSYNYNCSEHIYANAGEPMYWRIVRINGDGSIRMIYDGTEKNENGIEHSSSIGYIEYNAEQNEAKYLGYTYDDGTGTQVDSSVKALIDNWYDLYLEPNFERYIEDTIFCNDRQNIDGDSFFDSYDRIYTNLNPSLKCTNKNDRYTVNDTTNGNGLLSNPIGLLTGDEAMFAGAPHMSGNDKYYLYNGETFNIFFSESKMMGVTGNQLRYGGSIPRYQQINTKAATRPVINLKADIKFTGSGTIDDPYIINTATN